MTVVARLLSQHLRYTTGRVKPSIPPRITILQRMKQCSHLYATAFSTLQVRLSTVWSLLTKQCNGQQAAMIPLISALVP